MKKYFEFEKHKTTYTKEIIGGITTFLTMAYIIFVNPDTIANPYIKDVAEKLNIDNFELFHNALITTTCLSAFIGTILVALWAKVPFAMAPGMGLNAFFSYTLMLQNQISFPTALGIVFLSGIFFLILTIVGIREKIISSIPIPLRLAVASGIGLFITFIGLKNLNFITASPATFVKLGNLNTPVILGIIGTIIIIALIQFKVKGAILIGIISTYILGLIFNDAALPSAIISKPYSIKPILFNIDIIGAFKFSMIGTIFSFMFVDLFDSIGTIMACSYEADMVEKDGTIKNIDKMLEADAVATVAGSLLGTSTTTTYIESASGIAEGARTGFASIITAFLFLIALLFSPIISVIPSYATAPALIVVGLYMFKNIKEINFNDFTESFPAFLTIILMPLTFSISTGLSFGFLSFIVLNALTGRFKKITIVMWIIGIFCIINLVSGGH